MRMKTRIKDNWGLNMKYLQIRYFGFFFYCQNSEFTSSAGPILHDKGRPPFCYYTRVDLSLATWRTVDPTLHNEFVFKFLTLICELDSFN